MKIRLILLSIAGFIVYVALANFNSKLIRETEIPKDRGQVSAPQAQAGKQQVAETQVTAPLTAEQRKAFVPAPNQLTVQAPADGKLQQPQDELAQKDQQAKQIEVLTAEKEQATAELKRAKAELKQLQQKVATTIQTAGAQGEQAVKEKEAALAEARKQLQNQAGAVNQFKVQMAETAEQLTAAKRDLEQAERKIEALIRLGAEKEQQANTLSEQKKATEQALAEKMEALDKAILTIQSLRQEVAGQHQALATVQRLLDERSREFDQMHQKDADKIEQLNQQIALLGKDKAQAAKELEQCAAEVENSRKGAAELETVWAKMQASQAEAEEKVAAALESKKALQTQLKEKEEALGEVHAKIDALTAATTSLRNEKLGLASQLEALLADHNNLLAMKNAFEGQAAALAQAEGELKVLTALQAKNDEMSKALMEKDAALEQAAKQAETLTALQARLGEAAKHAEISDASITRLEQEKSDLAGQLAAAQALTQTIDELKKALDEKSNALTLAETKAKELDGIKEQIDGVEAKATAALTAQVAAEKKVAESEAVAKGCNESLTAVGDKVKQLEGDLGEAQNRVKELTDKHSLQAQQDLVPTLNQQILTLRNQLCEAAAATEAKNDEMKAANKKVQILQTERDGLQQELTLTQVAFNDLQKQMEAAKSQSQPATNAQDGVPGNIDLCPDSPADVPVNALGCPQDKAIVLEGVVFSSGTATLTPDSLKELDRIAAALMLRPQIKVEIAGYTDNVGDPRRNQRLSTQRAQAVSAYLTTGKGIDANRLHVKGYGAENPIGDNATAEGRQQNRRIELHVMAP